MPDVTTQDQIDVIIENAINETQLVGASVGIMRHMVNLYAFALRERDK